MALCLIPDILNSVDVVGFLLGKMGGVIGAKVPELADIERIVAATRIRIDHAVRCYFLLNNGHECVGFRTVNHLGVDCATSLQDAKNGNFSGRASASFSLANDAKITLVQLDITAKLFDTCLLFEGDFYAQ